jgi:adenine-specific DNA-methyltransferase
MNMSEKDLQKEIDDLQAQIRKLKKNNLGLVFEDKKEDVVTQCEKNIPVLKEVKTKRLIEKDRPNNLLIEGDNYHALSVLNYTHKKNIDLIYIDPPYNTGAKNWKYNNDYVDKDDEYRHSKWLSFMRHRLNLAKNLLKDDGVLICAIDENEQAHLSVLIEQIFPAHDQHTVTIVHNPKGVQGTNFSYTHEYAIFVVPSDRKTIGDRSLAEDEIYVSNLRNWGSESERTDAKNCFYPIIVSNGKIIGFGDVAPDKFHPKSANEKQKDGSVYIWPVDEKGVERKWRYARQSVDEIKEVLQVKESRGGLIQIMIAKDYGTYKTVWTDKKYDASEYGTKLLREIVPNSDFDFPKSLYTVYDCLFAVIGNRPHANVLDFFAGSGTTGHAVLEMNQNDGGNRKFILCTNNENNNEGNGGIAESVCYPRIKAVIKGYKNKKNEKVEGVKSSLYYYKTDLVDIEHLHKIPDEGKIRVTYQAGEMIAVREDTPDEVEKNDWWQIFEGNGRMTVIYFKEDKSKLLELIEKLDKKGLPVALYIFSWGKNEYKGEYSSPHIRVEDIPEPILEVYKEINRL